MGGLKRTPEWPLRPELPIKRVRIETLAIWLRFDFSFDAGIFLDCPRTLQLEPPSAETGGALVGCGAPD